MTNRLSSLPLTEFLSFLCLVEILDRCRHGGHAHHIVGWFSKQKVCPVAGCDCECEFDAAINITRPAICVAADD